MRRFIIVAVGALSLTAPSVASANALSESGPSKIRSFQSKHSLLVDGIYGQQTNACYVRGQCSGVAPGPLYRTNTSSTTSTNGTSNYSGGSSSSNTGNYSGGSYTIPREIVMCESGGNYGAVNPSSGARGAYQILPSTHASVCPDLDWSPGGQDRCASRIWATQGRGAWVC